MDVLPAADRHALVERGDNAHGAKHAGAGIAHGRARPGRWLVRMAVHPHCTAHRLGDHVEGQIVRVLTLRSEALDLSKDQSWIESAQPRILEAQACKGTRRHVLDQDIGLADHSPQQRLLEAAR